MHRHSLFIVAVILIFSRCTSDTASPNDFEKIINESSDKVDDNANEKLSTPSLSKKAFEDIMNVIPSPLEMSGLIKESGAQYKREILNPTENLKNYNNNYLKAVNLGIYGADLGYINMYTQFQNAIPYLTTIKKVADDLKIGQFFDFGLIKKLAMNNSNPDSLMMISTMGFEKMDAYLRDQNRENLSALILFGGWVETLYLSTQILEMYPSDALVERIGEQKLVVNKIDTLLNNYSNDPYFRELSQNFENLKASFENVEIVEEKGEVTYEELDGIKMAVDNSVTTTTVTDEALEEIKLNTLRVRSFIIN